MPSQSQGLKLFRVRGKKQADDDWSEFTVQATSHKEALALAEKGGFEVQWVEDATAAAKPSRRIGGWQLFLLLSVGLWLVESHKAHLPLLLGLAQGLGAVVVLIPVWSFLGMLLGYVLSIPVKWLRAEPYLLPMLYRASFGLAAGIIFDLFL